MRFRVFAIAATTLAALLSTSSPANSVAGFGDVEADAFFTSAVQWMVDSEITTGTSPGCFEPYGTVTRGQAAAFIWRMAGEPDAPAHSFEDVVAEWQQGAVSWMAHTGITTGTSPTTYSPDDPVTRGQIAALLWRLEGQPPAPAHGFDDVVAGWQQGAVSWMAHTGITTGTSPTTYSPDDPLTRGQIATFFWRYSGARATPVSPVSPLCNGPVDSSFDDGPVDLLGAGASQPWSVTNPSRADVADINLSRPGSLVLVPGAQTNNGWFASSQGPMISQEVEGDFAVAIRIRVVSVNDPDGLTPPGSGFNSGGFVVRSVADPDDWVMYNIGGQTPSSGFAREVKTTVDATSELELVPTPVREYRLMVCRVGAELRYFHGSAEGTEWTAEAVQHSRPDFGATVEVGIVANAWEGGPRPSVQVDAIAFGGPSDLASCTSSVTEV